jgi:hypothetical protein
VFAPQMHMAFQAALFSDNHKNGGLIFEQELFLLFEIESNFFGMRYLSYFATCIEFPNQ